MFHRPDEFTTFAHEPPIVQISGGVALIKYRCPGTDRAMSVRTFEQTVGRCRLALERFAAGETDVIVDG